MAIIDPRKVNIISPTISSQLDAKMRGSTKIKANIGLQDVHPICINAVYKLYAVVS